MLDDPGTRYIRWLVNVMEMDDCDVKLNFGICQESKKIAFMNTDIIYPLVMTDVSVDVEKGLCSDQEICLCKSCKLNKITHLTYIPEFKKDKLTEKQLDNLLKNIDDWNINLEPEIKILLDHEQNGMMLCKKPHFRISMTPKE